MEYKEFLKKKNFEIKDIGFHIDEEQLNPLLFDFQKELVKWAIAKGKCAIFADCGLGKGQPYGSKILTPEGWENIEKLKIGDSIYSSEGLKQKITGIYPKQKIETYRFFYSDKVSQVFDIDHLHIVRINNDRQRNKTWRVLSTRQIIENKKLRYGKDTKSRNFEIPIVKPIRFNKNKLNISPYTIGVLIGNSCIDGQVSISSNDVDIINRVRKELPRGVELKYRSKHDYFIKTRLTGNRIHEFEQELLDLGLYKIKAKNNFIPKRYLFSSVDDRLNLLRGIMDNAGSIKDTCQFCTTSEQLKSNVKFLIQSLGGVPTESIKKTTHNDCYVLTFSLKTFNPFYLKRKAKIWSSDPHGRWIDRIEFEKKQKTICIAVDSPNKSYVTDNFIVTHNTFMQLEWAKHVFIEKQRSILILAPLAVVHQTKREGIKFNIDVNVCESEKDMVQGINITNYEKIHKFNLRNIAGIVLDESSILKSYTGKFRNELLENTKNIKYKLACTATPAPNDFMELGNHSEFLQVLSRKEMLSVFFVHDGSDTSKWRLKKHGIDRFWRWMSNWSIMLKNPKDLGYKEKGFELKDYNVFEHIIKCAEPEKSTFFTSKAKTLKERQESRRNTIQERCEKASKIIEESHCKNWIVWCNLNAESSMLSKLIHGSIEIKGSDSNEYKRRNILDFSSGSVPILITKPKIAGFGMNLQICHNVIFVGLSDSFEQYYQALRRCWRFGQKKEVNVHIIVAEKEGSILDNIKRKQRDFEYMLDCMRSNVQYLQHINKSALIKKEDSDSLNVRLPLWAMGGGNNGKS